MSWQIDCHVDVATGDYDFEVKIVDNEGREFIEAFGVTVDEAVMQIGVAERRMGDALNRLRDQSRTSVPDLKDVMQMQASEYADGAYIFGDS